MCYIYCYHFLSPEPFLFDAKHFVVLIDIIVQRYLVSAHPSFATIPSDKINITSSPTLTLLSVYPRTLINRKHNIWFPCLTGQFCNNEGYFIRVSTYLQDRLNASGYSQILYGYGEQFVGDIEESHLKYDPLLFYIPLSLPTNPVQYAKLCILQSYLWNKTEKT